MPCSSMGLTVRSWIFVSSLFVSLSLKTSGTGRHSAMLLWPTWRASPSRWSWTELKCSSKERKKEDPSPPLAQGAKKWSWRPVCFCIQFHWLSVALTSAVVLLNWNAFMVDRISHVSITCTCKFKSWRSIYVMQVFVTSRIPGPSFPPPFN